MKAWNSRPPEVNNLFNPSFCGEAIRRFVVKYQGELDEGPVYPLVFLVLPIVFHKPTRDLLTISSRSAMHYWIQTNQEVRVGFASRAKDLLPITRESIFFLLRTRTLGMKLSRLVSIPRRRTQGIVTQQEGESYDIYKKSELLGKWFARSGPPATVFTMWGVRP